MTLRPGRPAGCSAGDYGGVDVRRAIVVLDDTGCSVVVKQNVAVAKGAVGLLVVTGGGPNGSPAGLFTPGYYRELTVPVGIIDPDTNAALRRTTAPVRLRLDGQPVMAKSRNVLAQTKTGDTRRKPLGDKARGTHGRTQRVNFILDLEGKFGKQKR